MIVSTEHAGTHIDAPCHAAENMVLFGGVRVSKDVQTSFGFTHGGVETIAPYIGRGIMLDVPACRSVERLNPLAILTRPDLEEVEEMQGTPIRKGDVALIRTGYGALWDQPQMYERAAGVDTSISNWLAEKHINAVGIDNASWDIPGSFEKGMNCSLPRHIILLARYGIYILEHLHLEELSKSGAREFLMIYAPLKLKGATGAPLRPLAVVT